jgi:homoserine dehydrogenase
VSANKQLLARHGAELQLAADRGGAQLRYEASACAAIPVVRVLQESLAAAGVDELIGIVNGTTNFMLTAMARDGQSYADALAEAQQLGYAEADPTEDVGGADAAAKLAILASLAFHRHLHIDDVPFEGIDTLHDDDVAFANERGCRATGSQPAWRRCSCPTSIRSRASAAASTPSCCAARRSARSRCRAPARAAPRPPPR